MQRRIREVKAWAITPKILEGVMWSILGEIGRVAANTKQGPWGPEWGGKFQAITIGEVSVEIESFEYDKLMHIEAFGQRCSTWLDSKRPFYHAHYPKDWSTEDFIKWAESVLIALGKIDTENFEHLLKCGT